MNNLFSDNELIIIRDSIETSTTSLMKQNKTLSNKIKKDKDERDKTEYLQLIEDNNLRITKLFEIGKKIDGIFASYYE